MDEWLSLTSLASCGIQGLLQRGVSEPLCSPGSGSSPNCDVLSQESVRWADRRGHVILQGRAALVNLTEMRVYFNLRMTKRNRNGGMVLPSRKGAAARGHGPGRGGLKRVTAET